METLQLKRNLHELIERIADNQLLEAVHTLLLQANSGESAAEPKSATDEWVLDEATRKMLDERIAHYKAHPEEGDSWPNVKARIQNKLEASRLASNRKTA